MIGFRKFLQKTFAMMINIDFRNSQLNSQRVYNPLASAMRSQVRWHCLDDELNSFIRWNLVRSLIQWYNGYRMNKYIFGELDKRFVIYESGDLHRTSRSVIDLALESYLATRFSSNAFKRLDRKFKVWAVTQIRLFLFVGHDFIFFIICYCYYLLFKCSVALARIRVEHDVVFGPDLFKVQSLLAEQAHLINQLSYIVVVIKEALRLFSAVSVMRGGLSGVELQDSSGSRYSTARMNIWILHSVLQRHSEYWKEPEAFIPDRWLVGPEDFLYPVKGAWRPFQFGSRNCVGQALVSRC